MYLRKLFNSGKTVFSSEDLGKILEIINKNYLKVVLSRLAKRSDLTRIKKGLYVINEHYNNFELANKLKRPSYISIETVLFNNNVIFQDYSKKITSVANNSYKETIKGVDFFYYKIKDEILTNPSGLVFDDNFVIASIERAVCDMIYLSKNFYFDNLENINKNRLKEISQIYNKRVIKEVEKICSI